MDAFYYVKNLLKEELMELVDEIHVLGRTHAPGKITQSKKMKELFDFHKREGNFWLDQYHDVNRYLSNEVVRRFRQKEKTMDTFTRVENLTNDELRDLMIEKYNHQFVDSPRNLKHSKIMQELLDLEKPIRGDRWVDQFGMIEIYLNNEVFRRFRENII